MSAEEEIVTPTEASATKEPAQIEMERSEKILKAKELYSQGSRNFLVKSYTEAADELSQVCTLYEELYGELSDELGMPYLLYAKSLIALALDENKVIDVPDAEDDDDGDDDGDEGDDEVEAAEAEANGAASSSSSAAAAAAADVAANGSVKKMATIKENCDEADSSCDAETPQKPKTNAKPTLSETEVSSSGADDDEKNGEASAEAATAAVAAKIMAEDEKPSTSNGEATTGSNVDEQNIDDNEEDNEAASSLQLAWEILELAAKIFSRQGLSGLANLAEVQTELANIEFENSILDAARDDYEKALKLYSELPTNYRRAMAEIHYKIGLTFLMQQLNKEGAASLKNACSLIEEEIETIKEKEDASEKDKNVIQDLEETKQEIWAKITEIEEMQAQTIAEVRAALDSYIKPMSGGGGGAAAAAAASGKNSDGAGPSSSSAAVVANGTGAASPTCTTSSAISSSSKPTDITHLIKRKKPDEPNSEAEAACSPAKRAAV